MQAKVLSLLLAAGATAVALPQCEYKGYLNATDCPAGSRAFLSATTTVGFCTQIESGYPVTSVKVSQLSPCPAGQTLVLDVSAGLCDSFETIATFDADGSCAEITVAQGASVQALKPRCV